ncbi:MAG: hypothetical protein WC236_10085 [Gallionellaceae bacterium]|jgi:hypothetical protein
MRLNQWLISLFFALTLGTAMAADATAANETGKLETINGTPATLEQKMKDCPMHQGKKECQHKKNGEPCPYHNEEKHHGKAHDKCDHKRES